MIENIFAHSARRALSTGPGIPKIIHQVFFGAQDTLPPVIRERIIRMQAMNPGWDYRFYDDDAARDFILSEYPATVWDRFQRINPAYVAARVDLFRYLLVYRLGGVYLDIKSTTEIPLDVIICPDDRYLLAQWGADLPTARWGLHPELANVPGGEYQQWHIIAAPEHPFLRAVIEMVLGNIDRYNPFVHCVGLQGTVRVTGPVAYTQAIAPIRDQYPHRQVRSNADLGLVYSVFGENTRHSRVIKSRYRRLTAPVVKVGPLISTLWWPKRTMLMTRRAVRWSQRRLQRRFRWKGKIAS